MVIKNINLSIYVFFIPVVYVEGTILKFFFSIHMFIKNMNLSIYVFLFLLFMWKELNLKFFSGTLFNLR